MTPQLFDTETRSASLADEKLQQIATEYNPNFEAGVVRHEDYERWFWNLKARLSGGWLKYDEKERQYKIVKPQGAKPLMNDEGIESTMSVLNGLITDINAYSIFEKDRIYEHCLKIAKSLSRLYFVNMDKFGLTLENASIVKRIVMLAVEANLNKSIGGKTLQWTLQNEKVITTRMEKSEEEQKRKIFGLPI